MLFRSSGGKLTNGAPRQVDGISPKNEGDTWAEEALASIDNTASNVAEGFQDEESKHHHRRASGSHQQSEKDVGGSSGTQNDPKARTQVRDHRVLTWCQDN